MLQAALAGIVLLAAAGGARAEAPERHRLGLFITGLHTFDAARGTFGATFWIWPVGPAASHVLRTADFVNAESLTMRLESSAPTGAGREWSQQRVAGTFRHAWDLRRYPFDRHRLEILIEEGIEELHRFAYEADTANAGFDLRETTLEGWRLARMRLEPWGTAYPTNFGDPAALEPLSRFSAIRVVLEVERTDRTGFVKLTAALYAAFLLCLIGCLVPANAVGFAPRITLLIAALFAVVLNMRTASAALGNEHGLTMIDGLHVAGLAYIVAIVAVTVAVRGRQERVEAGGGGAVAVVRLDRWLCGLAAVGFAVANLVLLVAAAR